MQQKPQGSPVCFGKEFDAGDSECAGGADPGYVNPRTGAQVRDRCSWFSACASVSAANRARAQHTIPASNLTRPHPQGPPRPAQMPPMPGTRPQFQQPAQMHPQQQQQAMAPMQPQMMVAPWVAQQGPQLVPMMVQQPGSQMQHYLTVPEPINLNENPWKRLMREIVRSMFKSAGHTSAAFFDHNPMAPHRGPED